MVRGHDQRLATRYREQRAPTLDQPHLSSLQFVGRAGHFQCPGRGTGNARVMSALKDQPGRAGCAPERRRRPNRDGYCLPSTPSAQRSSLRAVSPVDPTSRPTAASASS